MQKISHTKRADSHAECAQTPQAPQIPQPLNPTPREDLLEFIQRITPRLLAIELHLRDLARAELPEAYAAACGEHPAPMLGDLLRLLDDHKLLVKLMPDFAMHLPDYWAQNDETMRISRRRKPIYKFLRITAVLWLFRNVRNAAFHANDLLALYARDGAAKPFIFTQIHASGRLFNFSVAPVNIERFIDDLACELRVAGYARWLNRAV